jgi:hypothetical protein
MVKTSQQNQQDLTEHDTLPQVDGLDSTPNFLAMENSESSSAPAAPQADRDRLKRRMQDQATRIKALQEQLLVQYAQDALQESHNTQAELNSLLQQSSTPAPRETPGPHLKGKTGKPRLPRKMSTTTTR